MRRDGIKKYSKYRVILPSEAELKAELEREKARVLQEVAVLMGQDEMTKKIFSGCKRWGADCQFCIAVLELAVDEGIRIKNGFRFGREKICLNKIKFSEK